MDGGGSAAGGTKREFMTEDGSGDVSVEESGVPKRSRGSGPHMEIRVLLPNRVAGGIIGKGGSNIKRLREEFDATVLVPDTDGPERILFIATYLGSACEILSEVIKGFDSDEKSGFSSERSHIRFLVHQSYAGAIIGKGGSKIKELREELNAQIKVYSECCPHSTDRVLEVAGDVATISKAAYVIFDFLHQSQPKGAVSPYDPNNFDEYGANDYGGYGGFNSRGKWADGGRGYTPRRGGRMGGGRSGGFDRREGGSGARGGKLMDRNSGGLGGGLSFEDRVSAQNSSFTQVSIPKEYAGAIIGKGGSRIKQIRSESGAKITIDEAQAGSDDRIINIEGTADQIENAQYMLQMCVKQYGYGS